MHVIILIIHQNGDFWGIPKNWVFFQGKPQYIPKLEPIPIPKVSPIIFWGFSGIKPQKTPKFKPSPSPNIPRNFCKACPRPRPVPENSGRGRRKPGIGAPFPHTSNYRDDSFQKEFKHMQFQGKQIFYHSYTSKYNNLHEGRNYQKML